MRLWEGAWWKVLTEGNWVVPVFSVRVMGCESVWSGMDHWDLGMFCFAASDSHEVSSLVMVRPSREGL